jgi:hypothetical protein
MHCSLRCFESFITTKRENMLLGKKSVTRYIYIYIYIEFMYDPQQKKVN